MHWSFFKLLLLLVKFSSIYSFFEKNVSSVSLLIIILHIFFANDVAISKFDNFKPTIKLLTLVTV